MAFPLRTRTRGRPGRGAGVKSVAAAPSFNPLTSWTTGPVHAVWASDPAWTPPADGGAVSLWRNGGSVGTPNFTQATGTKQPTYRASTAAFNNQPTVQFDGADDVLLSDIATVDDPLWVLLICNTLTNAAGFYHWFGGGSGSRVFLWPATSGIYQSGDSGPGMGRNMVDTNAHMILGRMSGATSTLRLDASTSAAQLAFGDTALTYLSLGAQNTAGASLTGYLNGHIAYMGVFTTDPTALPEWAGFTAWVLSNYGITV